AAVRESVTRLPAAGPVLDTAGTGGDEKRSFNVSTVAAIIAAAAGARVAKLHHGAVSSRCGSTELLEAFGVATDLTPDAAARCLNETGLCFLAATRYFAAAHRQVDAADRTSEGRALIHLLTLLAHPAGAEHRLVGVA